VYLPLSQDDPKNISLHYTVGMLYQLAGRPQEVCDHLYQAYQVGGPDHVDPQLLFHLANNLKAIGENEAAVDFYGLAIGPFPTVFLFPTSSLLAYEHRDAVMSQGVHVLLPGDVNARAHLWCACIYTGKIPTGAVNWVLVAISLDYVGRPREAVRAFQVRLYTTPPPLFGKTKPPFRGVSVATPPFLPKPKFPPRIHVGTPTTPCALD
jgi:hypothetical protein